MSVVTESDSILTFQNNVLLHQRVADASTTTSMTSNSRGDSTQPYKTPTNVSNQFDNSPFVPTFTALLVDL